MKIRYAVPIALAFVFAALGIVTLAQTIEPAPPQERLPALMLAKTASTQAIVAGLVSNDFDQIRRGATDLVRICDALEWSGSSDETYVHHRDELKRQAMKLTRVAEDRNLDAAAYVYMHTVSTCIQCHQHCRDVLRIAGRKRPASGVITIPTDDAPVEWNHADAYRR